jgi:hypothetical protein
MPQTKRCFEVETPRSSALPWPPEPSILWALPQVAGEPVASHPSGLQLDGRLTGWRQIATMVFALVRSRHLAIHTVGVCFMPSNNFLFMERTEVVPFLSLLRIMEPYLIMI